MKDANNMKILKDKFNKWNSLIPYLRRIDATTLIQAWFRGGLIRDDLRRFNRINELLLNIVSRYKNDPAPYFQKWAKNARLLKALEMGTVIQNFIRNRLNTRMKTKAYDKLKQMFQKKVHKRVAEVLKEAGKFNPEDYDKFEKIIMNAVRREPYEKLKKGLRWIAILRGIKFAPELFDKFRKNHLRKYLERWFENGYLIPNSAANLLQAIFKGYMTRKRLASKGVLRKKLIDIINICTTKKEDYLHSALLKWLKIVRKMVCIEDGNLIRDFCRMIREKCIMEVQTKWKKLAHKFYPHEISTILRLAKFNDAFNKRNKKRFFDKRKTK